MVPWEDGWTVASLIDKHLHRKMRRTLSHGISTEALRRFEPTVVAQLDILTQMITEKKHYDDEWSSPQDMSRICKLPLRHPGNKLIVEPRQAIRR